MSEDYKLKQAWNTFSFEFQKIVDEMRSETEKLFVKIFKDKFPVREDVGCKTPDHWMMTGCLNCGAWTGKRTPCHVCGKDPLVKS